MNPETALANDIIEALDRGLAPREALVAFVHRVDLEYERSLRAEPDGERTRATWLVIARAVVALHSVITAGKPHPGLDATRDAAEQVVADPTVERWDQLFEAATASYPFGPGEGCFALEQLGGHGAPGAGCASGVGFVACMLPADRDPEVHAALCDALLPWARSRSS